MDPVGFGGAPSSSSPESDPCAAADVAERMMKMNYWPVVAGGIAAGRFMGPEGLFVAFGAAAALSPTPGMAAYGASKAAVHHYVQTFGSMTGPSSSYLGDAKTKAKRNARKRGRTMHLNDMTACAILPSVLDTPANRKSFPPDTSYDDWVKPEDVANEIGLWIEKPYLRPHSGSLIKVSVKRGRAAEEVRKVIGSSGAFFTLAR